MSQLLENLSTYYETPGVDIDALEEELSNLNRQCHDLAVNGRYRSEEYATLHSRRCSILDTLWSCHVLNPIYEELT